MERSESLVDWIGKLLNTGIGGTQFTPFKMMIVLPALATLVFVTGRVTRWFVSRVLEGRGLDVGLAAALGALVRCREFAARGMQWSTAARTAPPEAKGPAALG